MINPSRIFGAIGLTGSGEKTLDSLPSNLVKDGDVAIVCDGLNVYFYTLDEDSNLDENVPFIIKPDDIDASLNPLVNYKRWVLVSQKYFVDNVILSLNKYLQTSEIRAIDNHPIKFISSDGNIVTIAQDGSITLNNTTVNGQITVKNDGRKPPLIVDSSQKVINLNADKLDGYDADKFMFTDASKAFTAPVKGVDPVNSNELTTKSWVESYIVQIQDVIYTYIDNAIASISIIADLAALTNRFNAHISPSSDDHSLYVHTDGRRNFTGTIGGIYPIQQNHLTTKQYVDSAISNIVTIHSSLTQLDDDDHLQYVHVDSRRGFTNPVLGKTPLEDFHLATKEYVDERIANIFHTKKLQIHTFDHETNQWVINHNFNNKHIVVDFYEKFTNMQIKPDKFVLLNDNTAIAYFNENIQGYAAVNGLTQHYNFPSSQTWTVEHTSISKYNIFNIFNNLDEEIFPDTTSIIDDTHISFTFQSPVSGYVVLSNDVTVLEISTPSTEWNIYHSYNNKNVLANCFTYTNIEIIPREIEATDDNTLRLQFEHPEKGYVIISGSEAVILDPGLFIINHDHLRNLDSDDHLQYTNRDGSRGFTGTISGITPTGPSHLTTKLYVDNKIDNAISIIANHHSLTGLLGDDHLQYILVNGLRGFTGTISGITPIYDNHLATKYYVDATIQGYLDIINAKIDEMGNAGNIFLSHPLSDTWTLNHNFGTKFVSVTIYDNSDNEVEPKDVTLTNMNTVTVTFDFPIAGYAVITGNSIEGGPETPPFIIEVDHGSLTGLLGDDHTQYILVDGTRGFTGTISGITPINDDHLTTKYYVDSSIITIQDNLDIINAKIAEMGNAGNIFLPHTLSDTWILTHNFGVKYVSAVVYGSDDKEITPKDVILTDYNTVTVIFDSPVSGYAVITGNVVEGGPEVPPFIIEGDHGSLTGLLGDDHTQYILTDGTRGFTGTVSGITPVYDDHLTTKYYVDNVGIDHARITNSSALDYHCQYVHIDGRRGFTAPIKGVYPLDYNHLTTKQYVDDIVSTTASRMQKGLIQLVSGSDNITAFLTYPILSGYSVSITIENLIDPSPSIYGWVLRQKSTSSFSIEFSSNIDSPNYKMNWIAYPVD